MFGMRIDVSGKWQFEGSLTPRLDFALRNPGLTSKDHSWATRVTEKIMSSSEAMQLLTRAEKCIVNGEAFVLSAKEAGLDAWTESQKTDLRTCLSYMREVLRNKAMLTTSLTTGKQRRAVPKGRGFGGGGAGKAKSKAKGPKKRKR